jgi:mono/diheme cytochrome c family protein
MKFTFGLKFTHRSLKPAIALGGAFLLFLGLAGVANAQDASSQNPIFQRKCALCHGQDGSGQTDIGKSLHARDLRSAEVQIMTDEELIKIITGGKDKMPAYKDILKEGQIVELAKYVHSLGSKKQGENPGITTLSSKADLPLSGVIDIHVHCSPDSVPRSIDAIDLARLAKERGMRGFVLKNHYESTAALAYIVRKEVPGIEVFGGIVLNLSVGGINLAALQRMILMDGGLGRVVWMPTQDNENHVKYGKEDRPFVSISKDGKLLPEVVQVIDFVAKHQLTLETGHSSPADGLLLVREARKRGVKNVIVTHAIGAPVLRTISQMQEAANDGAYIEFTAHDLAPGKVPALTASDYVKAIRAIGVKSCILSSDLGQPNSPLHPDGLITYFAALRKEGLSQADIDQMSKTNPARSLGL